MAKKEPKKAWLTPELIVLVRSKPEEAVLALCKIPSVHIGPGNPNCKSPKDVYCQVQSPS